MSMQATQKIVLEVLMGVILHIGKTPTLLELISFTLLFPEEETLTLTHPSRHFGATTGVAIQKSQALVRKLLNLVQLLRLALGVAHEAINS